MKFGLIGESLSHSFSKSYFEKNYPSFKSGENSYENIECKTIEDLYEEFDQLKKSYTGLNVTIPYKSSVMPLLDEIHHTAEDIKAVNCISIKNKKAIGYNTDMGGFWKSIEPYIHHHKKTMILGTGGASQAVEYALRKKAKLETVLVSRTPSEHQLSYEEANLLLHQYDIIINTTPLGMYPNIEKYPNLAYDKLSSDTLVVDLIYNPAETMFLKKAREQGCQTLNGQKMLEYQADMSFSIWTGK